MAREQRARARRAIAEAETALERLEAARARAESLLRGTRRPSAPDGAGPSVPPEEALRRRIRRIEDRMQETDSLMRRAEESRAGQASPERHPSDDGERDDGADDASPRDAEPGR